jgi:hypothetical protein
VTTYTSLLILNLSCLNGAGEIAQMVTHLNTNQALPNNLTRLGWRSRDLAVESQSALTFFEANGGHFPNGCLAGLHILVQLVQEVSLMLRV